VSLSSTISDVLAWILVPRTAASSQGQRLGWNLSLAWKQGINPFQTGRLFDSSSQYSKLWHLWRQPGGHSTAAPKGPVIGKETLKSRSYSWCLQLDPTAWGLTEVTLHFLWTEAGYFDPIFGKWEDDSEAVWRLSSGSPNFHHLGRSEKWNTICLLFGNRIWCWQLRNPT
jgi:hypothetical protein